jgi:alanine racemase
MIERYGRIYATIDLDAIRSNMDSMQAKLSEGTKVIGVIKMDGYGHGAVPIAKELEPLWYMYGFATATAEEAMILRDAGIAKPILVLGYAFPWSYEEMIGHDVRAAVFREDMLGQLADASAKAGKKAKVHIKVDTGMSRIGIRPDEAGLEFVKKALENPAIEVEGIFTHFAKADEADKAPARNQLALFREFIGNIEAETGYVIPLCHCSNSAGMIGLREADMDAVRAGIAMYGLWPSPEVAKDAVELEPAMELKSRIVYIKNVEAGTEISYGGTYTAGEKRRIATIAAGYGDGYPRGLSNKGYVLIHGKKAPVTGRICMDQFMIDVTDIPDAAEGDIVTLIGREGEERITIEELGELSGRFHYELACCIGKRVPRVYLKSGKIRGTKDYFQDFK